MNTIRSLLPVGLLVLGTLGCLEDCSGFDTSLCTGGPPGWTCDVLFYGTDDGCDCGCGAPDPDCLDGTVESCDFCDDEGSCNPFPGCPGDINPTQNWLCDGATAVCGDKPDVVKLLLDHGADPNALDVRRRGALHRLHGESEHAVAMTRVLLAAGFDGTTPDAEGQSAIDHAREVGLDDVVDLLRRGLS